MGINSQFISRPLYPRRKCLQYPLNRRLKLVPDIVRPLWRRGDYIFLPVIERRRLGCPTFIIFTITTTYAKMGTHLLYSWIVRYSHTCRSISVLFSERRSPWKLSLPVVGQETFAQLRELLKCKFISMRCLDALASFTWS